MSYLGNAPARSFISFERQVFTIVNSQTAYTLSHSVTNENDIRLVVNNVVQEPGSGKAYTASGTTLTLSAALTNGTDEMYCVFLRRAVGTVNAPAGSVGTSQLVDLNVTTGKIAADAITNAKIADDAISDEQLDPTVITGQTAETSIATDDLILLSDTSASGALKKMTRANFVSGVGGVNTPAFLVGQTSNQSISSSTWTILNWDNEDFDIGGGFDISNNKFVVPSGEAGIYHFTVWVTGDSNSGYDRFHTAIWVNDATPTFAGAGSRYTNHAYPNLGSGNFSGSNSFLYNASVGDYFTVKLFQDFGSNITTNENRTWFYGYKIIQ